MGACPTPRPSPSLPQPRCTTCSVHPRNPTPPPPQSATGSSTLPSVQKMKRFTNQQPQKKTAGVKYGEVMILLFFLGGGSLNEIQTCLNTTHMKLWALFPPVFYWWKIIPPFCLNLWNHPLVSDLWASNIKNKHTKKKSLGGNWSNHIWTNYTFRQNWR